MMLWLVDTDILSEEHMNFPNVIRELGHNCIEISNLHDNIDKLKIDEPCIAYGSFQFIKQLRERNITPITFGVTSNINISSWIGRYPNNWFLNSEFEFTVWQDFVNRPEYYFEKFDIDKLFIRPDSGFKTFSGQVISLDNIKVEIESIDRYSSVSPNTFIFLAPFVQEEITEFRFYIVDRKIVTYSHYDAYDKDKHLDIQPSKSSFELVDKILKTFWQVDDAYTVDIAETSIVKDTPKSYLLEFNSLSCAGLYPQCDSAKLVTAIVEFYAKENL